MIITHDIVLNLIFILRARTPNSTGRNGHNIDITYRVVDRLCRSVLYTDNIQYDMLLCVRK